MKKIDTNLLYKMFEQGIKKLTLNKSIVDSLNVFPVPDGDTGTNMSMTVNYALEEIKRKKPSNIKDLTSTMSKGCLMGARGNSGVILSQIFRGFASSSKIVDVHSVKSFAIALDESAKVAYKAVLKPVEGTILTVIKDISNRALEISEEVDNFDAFFEEILIAGKRSLENTPNLLPILKEAGVVDSGAQGLIYIIEGWEDALHGRITEADEVVFETDSSQLLNYDKHVQGDIDPSSITFTYCTEFVMRKHNDEDIDLLERLEEMGDSLVYVPDEDLVKVHIHTDHPGTVYEMALEYGILLKTKIENMREQHGALSNEDLESESVEDKKTEKTIEEKNHKENAFIAIASGNGIIDIYKELQVDYVIEGGQTMNPSTQDITEAINSVEADNIFIFPNNSNIILAANQARDLSSKNIYVLPTKAITQGFSCMINFDENLSAEENYEQMLEAINEVKSIQITNSIRDTKIGDIEISENDYLGILDGNIVVSDKELENSIKTSIEKAIDDESSIVSFYYGEQVEEAEAQEIVEKLEKLYPSIEFEIYNGNQPVYYYYISIE